MGQLWRYRPEIPAVRKWRQRIMRSGFLWLYIKLEASLADMRPYNKTRQNKPLSDPPSGWSETSGWYRYSSFSFLNPRTDFYRGCPTLHIHMAPLFSPPILLAHCTGTLPASWLGHGNTVATSGSVQMSVAAVDIWVCCYRSPGHLRSYDWEVSFSGWEAQGWANHYSTV